MRTWTHRGCVALLTLAVAVPALRAAPPSENPPIDSKLTDLQNKLIDLQVEQQKIAEKLNTLLANQDLIRSMADDIDRLKSDLRRLNDEVRRLSATPSPNVSASINPAAPSAQLLTGTILLENRYSSPATVVVNGTSIRLNPFERQTVTAPLGRFTYSVSTDNYGPIQGQTDRILSADRIFPITINP